MASQSTLLTVHFNFSEDLKTAIESRRVAYGKNFSRQIQYYLDFAMALVRNEKRFYLIPKKVDLGPYPCEKRVEINRSDLEFLEQTARDRGITLAHQLRELIRAGMELVDQLNRPELPLCEEELMRRARKALEERYLQAYQTKA